MKTLHCLFFVVFSFLSAPANVFAEGGHGKTALKLKESVLDAFASNSNVGFSGFAKVVSNRVLGNGLEIAEEPALQGALTYQTNSCLWVELWGSRSFSNEGDQIDYTIGCHRVRIEGLEKVFRVKFSLFDIGDVGSFGDDIINAEVGLNFDDWKYTVIYNHTQSNGSDGYGLDVAYSFGNGFSLAGRVGQEEFSDQGFAVAKASYKRNLTNHLFFSLDLRYQVEGSQKGHLNGFASVGVEF